MHRLSAPVVLLAALLAGGCGNSRTRPADLSVPDSPRGSQVVDVHGLRFRAPANWGRLPAAGPQVGGVSSKRAVVAVWRYPRTEALPTSRTDLERVRRLLEERVRVRDSTYVGAGAHVVRRGGARAIELIGAETINGLRVRVRSLHVFARATEWVVDAYAPAEVFDRLDREVFAPLERSVRVRA